MLVIVVDVYACHAGDNVNVIGKQGLMEKMIVRRFFSRKHGLPDMANWMTNQVCVCVSMYEDGLWMDDLKM